jgi:co-chaperonin GroES (HSP10)
MKPRKGLFFVRKYTKPEKIGHIYTNPAWRTDNSRSLWEVLEETELPTGVTLQPDWIVVTAPHRGVFVKYEGGIEIFALSKAEVAKIIPWTDEDIPIAPDRVMVVPINEEPSILVRLDKPEIVRGTVVEVGATTREGLTEGDVVGYTKYAGIEVELAGKLHILLSEDEILWRENDG